MAYYAYILDNALQLFAFSFRFRAHPVAAFAP